MGKISKLERENLLLKDKLLTKQVKPFKLTRKMKSLMKKSGKSVDSVLVLYLTQKYKIEEKLCPVISGDLVVVRNKVHRLNPKKIWRWGKHTAYIIREISRTPVSNEDYDEVVAKGDDTTSDVPLIKAVLGAIQKPAIAKKNTIIAVVVIAIIAAILLIIFS